MRTKTRPPLAPSASRAPAASTDSLAELAAKLASTQLELHALYTQLERLNRLASIGTIAGMIAHEFNNILTPIVSYSQMAAAAPDDRALTQKALARTLAGSERAAKIADAILSFVRDEREEGGGANDLFHVEHDSLQSANVASVVRDALSCLGTESAQDVLGNTVRVPENLNAAMHPIALQQVLVNLILNARNATAAQGGSIELAAVRVSHEPQTPAGAADSRRASSPAHARSTWNTTTNSANAAWVCITIQDTGCGMSPEQLARMFTPFDTRSLGTHRGTGLGMVITKRLVERANGWLIVVSERDRGTTTTIVLPAE